MKDVSNLKLDKLSGAQLKALCEIVDLNDLHKVLANYVAEVSTVPSAYKFDNGERFPLRNFSELNEYYGRLKIAREMRQRKESEQRAHLARTRRFVCLFVIAAKMAKADGHVDASEVRVAERLFLKLGIKGDERELFVKAFNDAIKTTDSIYSYAQKVRKEFHLDTRMFLYELLWDVACADGVIVDSELSLLRQLCEDLGVGYDSYVTNFRRRATFYNQGHHDEKKTGRTDEEWNEGGDKRGEEPRGALSEAYVILGCVASMTDDELKRKYRAAAKSYHPDMLRSKGIPDDLIAAANEKMIRLNEAWAMICKARGI